MLIWAFYCSILYVWICHVFFCYCFFPLYVWVGEFCPLCLPFSLYLCFPSYPLQTSWENHKPCLSISNHKPLPCSIALFHLYFLTIYNLKCFLGHIFFYLCFLFHILHCYLHFQLVNRLLYYLFFFIMFMFVCLLHFPFLLSPTTPY